MKKMILGMMLVAGMAAYGNTNAVSVDGTIQMSATSEGALEIVTTSSNLEFGNLRTITEANQTTTTTFTIADGNWTSSSNPTIKFEVSGNLNLKTETTAPGVKEVPVTIVVNGGNRLALLSNEATSVTIAGTVVPSVANSAAVGTYSGEFTVKATYEI